MTDRDGVTDNLDAMAPAASCQPHSTNDTAPSDYGTAMNVLAPLTTTGGAVHFECLSTNGNTNAFDTSLVAIQVDSLSGALHHVSRKTLRPQVAK